MRPQYGSVQQAHAPTARARMRPITSNPYPIASWLLERGFLLSIDAVYRRVSLLPDDFQVRPGTLVASNHQRDTDVPVIGPLLAKRHHLRPQGPLPFFATREDMFRPGFLTRLTRHWPRPVRAMLGRIPLTWFSQRGHADPMRRVREFTLGETLRALRDAGCADDPCATLLNGRGRRELQVTDTVTLAELLADVDPARLEHWWGLRRLTLPALAKVAPAFRAVIAVHIAHFASRLDHGHCVYFAPEGTVSNDGRFGRIRAGCFRAAHLADAPPWVLPMALSYDALGPGRTRVLTNAGPYFRADTTLDRRDFDAALRHAILTIVPVTPSHLLAHFLLHGPATFAARDLAGWIDATRLTLERHGTVLDPLFEGIPTDRLVGRRLRWLVRQRLVARQRGLFRNTCRGDAPPGWRAPTNVVRYLDNALLDCVPGIARLSPC